jgi:hypothetical protein
MAVDREQWAEKFDELPHWQCPRCKKGHLLPMKDKIWLEETGPSLAEKEHDYWEPDWTLNRFAGFLQCSMPKCAEVAAISGSSPTELYEYQDEYEHYQKLISHFVVKSIDPTPFPIRLPAAIPDAVHEAIRVSASLIWLSAEASGNQIRQAVELMLDDIGAPSMTANGKRITLHDRIEEFAKSDKENGEILLATKWLGNSGSHPGGLTRDNVLDAFEMLEHVLEGHYGTTKKDLMAKVAAVNAQKGPAKKVP